MTHHKAPAPPWAIMLAFAIMYLAWGTTYLAIQVGVRDEQLPPFLFGGTRVGAAGVILLLVQCLRRQSLRLPLASVPALIGISGLLFVGGNGLITVAEKTVNSGVAAVLAATTPLWLGLFAMFWPDGDRLTGRGWLGLLLGLAGVLVLLSDKFTDPLHPGTDWLGATFVLGSAAFWSLGSLFLRRLRHRGDHLTSAAYQMILGGIGLTVFGLAMGERFPGAVTPRALGAFTYLLVVGSLLGFVAFNWLLGHVSAARVGTYAYVNPAVAVLVGWAAGEPLTWPLLAGIGTILLAVFLVRGGEQPVVPHPDEDPVGDPAAAET